MALCCSLCASISQKYVCAGGGKGEGPAHSRGLPAVRVQYSTGGTHRQTSAHGKGQAGPKSGTRCTGSTSMCTELCVYLHTTPPHIHHTTPTVLLESPARPSAGKSTQRNLTRVPCHGKGEREREKKRRCASIAGRCSCSWLENTEVRAARKQGAGYKYLFSRGRGVRFAPLQVASWVCWVPR